MSEDLRANRRAETQQSFDLVRKNLSKLGVVIPASAKYDVVMGLMEIHFPLAPEREGLNVNHADDGIVVSVSMGCGYLHVFRMYNYLRDIAQGGVNYFNQVTHLVVNDIDCLLDSSPQSLKGTHKATLIKYGRVETDEEMEGPLDDLVVNRVVVDGATIEAEQLGTHTSVGELYRMMVEAETSPRYIELDEIMEKK